MSIVKNIYIGRQGQQIGPFSLDEVRFKVASGELSLSDLCWQQGMSQWMPIGSRVEIISAFPPAMPANQHSNYHSFSTTKPANQHFSYAGFWIRFLASLIDSVITGSGILLMRILVNGNILDMSTWFWELLLPFLYYALMEQSVLQATLGKRLFGLTVLTTEGHPLSLGQSFGRTLGKALSGIIIGIGYLMVAFSKKKQGLHDKMAGTIVVKK